MLRRIVPLFALVVGFFYLSAPARGAAVAGESFTITSATYTDAQGKQQTVNFDATTGIAQIPAVAANNDIIINGTYAPANGMVTATIRVFKGNAGVAAIAPACNNGNWTAKITKGDVTKNTTYTVASEITNTGNTATVNAKNVPVAEKTLSIAAN